MPRTLSARRDYKSLILATGPVAYWRMNQVSGNALDSSGNNNTLTVGAAPPALKVPGLLGSDPDGGQTFQNSATGAFTLADSGSFPTLGALTLECWAARTDLTAGTTILIGKGQATGVPTTLQFALLQDNIYAYQFCVSVDGAAITTVTTVAVYNDTKPHHVVGVYYPSNRTEIWVDGVRQNVNTTTIPAALFNSAADLCIGGGKNDAGAGVFAWLGTLDEVAIYTTALTPTMIQAHYQRGLAVQRGYAAQVLLDAPIGYWRMDEAEGNFQDVSGNNLTLTPGSALVGYRRTGLLLPFGGGSAQVPTGTVTPIGFRADEALLSITGNLTLECWIKRPDTTTSTWVLIGKGQPTGSPTNQSYTITIDGNNTLRFLLSADGSTVIATAAANNALLDTNVHHIVTTYQQTGTVVTLYIDGQRVKRATNGPASLFDSAMTLRIGAGSSNADAALNSFTGGLMQDVAIYNTVLSPARVAAHYKMGRFTRAFSAARALV